MIYDSFRSFGFFTQLVQFFLDIMSAQRRNTIHKFICGQNLLIYHLLTTDCLGVVDESVTIEWQRNSHVTDMQQWKISIQIKVNRKYISNGAENAFQKVFVQQYQKNTAIL